MEKNVITINKKLLSIEKKIEVVGDVIVPDIKPDIVSIINVNGLPYIYKEEVLKGKIRLDGNIDIYVVYLETSGETRSLKTTLSIAENLEDSNIIEDAMIKENVILEGIDAKILNERKITITANIRLESEVYEKSEIEIMNNLEEMEDVEKLEENLDIKSLISIGSVKTSIKEDISVDKEYDVAEILKTDIEISNLENKISFNKILAKADANIKILFLTEDGRISSVKSTIPVMSFIDMKGITEQNICISEYYIRNILFKVNSKDMHSITCQIDFQVKCEASKNCNISVVQDLYGIRKDIEFTKKEVVVELNKPEEFENITLNEQIKIDDILNLLDYRKWIVVTNKTKSGNIYNYECVLNLEIYYDENSKNGLNVKKVEIPFIAKSQSENLKFKISKEELNLRDGNLDFSITILHTQNQNIYKKIGIIENIGIKEIEGENDYKMFMYFVKPGDTIWKIAKKFKVCMSDILKINNIENPDKINIGDRLYILR